MSKRKENLEGAECADLMTMEQAAYYLHMTHDTLRAWLKDKKIAYYQLGSRKMFKLKDLVSFVESCRVEVE